MKALFTIEKDFERTGQNINIFIICIHNIIISYHNTLSYKSLTGIIYLKARKLISIVKPSTVLYKCNCLRKKRWLFRPIQKSKSERPQVRMKIRRLIIEIKKLNLFWGIRRISHEIYNNLPEKTKLKQGCKIKKDFVLFSFYKLFLSYIDTKKAVKNNL